MMRRDWARRALETRGWRRGADARSLRSDLRRRLAPPAEGLHPLLRPDPEPPSWPQDLWRRKLELPPCRLVWVGNVLAAPDGSQASYVEVLVEPLTESGEGGVLQTLCVPLAVLRLLTVGRALKELPHQEPRHAYGYGGPGPRVRFSAHERLVDLWISRPETAIVTAAEIPALAITTLAAYPSFASAPLCVMADRPARRLLIVACWEIFRFYYANSVALARLIFQFPTWRPETSDRLLGSFDGQRFWSVAPRSPLRPRVPTGYAQRQLEAIARDAVVAYACSGRAQIRAVPPFLGAARLTCIGLPVRLGEFEALFVQQILGSEPQDGEPGAIRWTSCRAPRW